MLKYLCFLAVILGVKAASAPFITPCKPGDSACLVSSAQAAVPILAPGIPDLGIKSMDPMFIPKITSNHGGLKLEFKDTTVTGMSGCTVENLKHDLSKNKQSITLKCSVELTGDYNLDGNILVLPIKGEGKYVIKIRDIIIKATSEISVVNGADGKPHWHITNWKDQYQVKTGAHFSFDNLFNGNKVLATPVEQFVNENWQDVMKEIAPEVVHAIVAEVVHGVEALYKSVPEEELTRV